MVNSLQVNINNIFRENNYFPKETIFAKSTVSLTVLQISLVSDLIEDSQIFRSAAVFSLLQTDTSCSLRKTLLCTCVRKGAVTSQCYESSFDVMDSPERALDIPINVLSKKKKNALVVKVSVSLV